MEVNKKRQMRIERQRVRYRKYLRTEIQVFRRVLVALFLLGLLVPLRPTASEVEKRELEKFPEVSAEGILKGDFFEGVSTWYADTFPFREKLLTANAAVERLYGLGKQQIHGTVGKGDEIPTEYTEATPEPDTKKKSKKSKKKQDTDQEDPSDNEEAAQGDEGQDGMLHEVPESVEIGRAHV